MRLSNVFLVALLTTAVEFVAALQSNVLLVSHRRKSSALSSLHCADDSSRRTVLLSSLLILLVPSAPALAAIDVSGLRQEGGGGGNSAIREQLKSYDGSASSRVEEIRRRSSQAPEETIASRSNSRDEKDAQDTTTAATYAYRSAPGLNPRVAKIGFGATQRLEDTILGENNRYLRVSFEFPSDWLQLDKLLGGFQFVDQRNGDKLYLLRAKLPESLTTINKKFFGDSIFDPQGTIVRGGVNIDDYRVKSSEILSDGSIAAPHRRLLIKYATVTGNGLRTERRMLVNAYEYDSVAYMLVTSSNAVKFDAQGRERDTVESIINSFRVEKV